MKQFLGALPREGRGDFRQKIKNFHPTHQDRQTGFVDDAMKRKRKHDVGGPTTGEGGGGIRQIHP